MTVEKKVELASTPELCMTTAATQSHHADHKSLELWSNPSSSPKYNSLLSAAKKGRLLSSQDTQATYITCPEGKGPGTNK